MSASQVELQVVKDKLTEIQKIVQNGNGGKNSVLYRLQELEHTIKEFRDLHLRCPAPKEVRQLRDKVEQLSTEVRLEEAREKTVEELSNKKATFLNTVLIPLLVTTIVAIATTIVTVKYTKELEIKHDEIREEMSQQSGQK